MSDRPRSRYRGSHVGPSLNPVEPLGCPAVRFVTLTSYWQAHGMLSTGERTNRSMMSDISASLTQQVLFDQQGRNWIC